MQYVISANELHPTLYEEINAGEAKYDLYKIPKDLFYLVTAHEQEDTEEQVI